MAYQGVLVIHRPDQDEFEPLNEHQEKHECGCGWWDRRKSSDLPARIPVQGLPEAYLCDILCLPDGQLLFRPELWTSENWTRLIGFFQENYSGHLASVVMCHS